jgi:uncharacterized protein DUF3854
VNPHLAHLLSRAYDGALAPEHRADLCMSGLTDEMIVDQFMRSVPPALLSRLLGFDLPGIQSALLFPFRAPARGFMDHVRVKVFPSLVSTNGHTLKYLQPRGTGPRLYFVSAVSQAACQGPDPLWLVEGEKKAMAVAQLGLPAVGFCGVEGWHVRGERRLLPDFRALRLPDRIIEIVPDADYQTNPAVKRAIERLGAALRLHGARPRVVLLPSALPQ